MPEETDSRGKVMYIKFNGRSWCVYCNPNDELIALPTDEEEASRNDLIKLQQYLYDEGFFADHYQRRLNTLDEF
jgi:hypothetical protein